MICSKCKQPRGKHTVSSYHCPTENGKFHPTHKFSLYVERLNATDFKKLLTGRGRSYESMEQEIARRVLKQVESTLAVYDLQSKPHYNRQELIESLDLIKRGYEI